MEVNNAELLMVGIYSCTYRIGEVVVKVLRIDNEAEITQENAKAMKVEANVYTILGPHKRIAHCLFTCPTRHMIMIEFYANGNLKDYIRTHGATQASKWAKQMIQGIEWIHSKGVRHSDIRLEQWLVDSELDVRLSDFNASGYDDHSALGIPGAKALGNEEPSYFMPRDPSKDNTVRSDLFALGSALFELESGTAPFAGVSGETITERFIQGNFPTVSRLTLGSIILGCWTGKYGSATELFHAGERLFGSDSCAF